MKSHVLIYIRLYSFVKLRKRSEQFTTVTVTFSTQITFRLGYQVTPAPPKESAPLKPKLSNRRYESPRRFDSSLGSDTGTSTRESECSEEHSSPTSSPANPDSTKLFDSLAAELRAKLNGNGPPLLLPPRDYDTVHRSQGNLAAIELRRFVTL